MTGAGSGETGNFSSWKPATLAVNRFINNIITKEVISKEEIQIRYKFGDDDFFLEIRAISAEGEITELTSNYG